VIISSLKELELEVAQDYRHHARFAANRQGLTLHSAVGFSPVTVFHM